MIPIKDSVRLRRVPLASIMLVAANVVVYLLAARHGGSLLSGPRTATLVRFGAVPYAFTHSAAYCRLIGAGAGAGVACTSHSFPGRAGAPATWETAFSAMFLQANLLQLAGNALILALLGPSVEQALGRLRLLAFYLFGGLCALGLQIAVAPDSRLPALAASGAIATLLGGYVVLYPRARVLCVSLVPYFFGLVDLPAGVLVAAWLIFDLLTGVFGAVTPLGGAAGAAYYAQLGGAIAGLIAIRLFTRGARRAPNAQLPAI